MYKTYRVTARIEGEIELLLEANSPEEAEIIAEEMAIGGEYSAITDVSATVLDIVAANEL